MENTRRTFVLTVHGDDGDAVLEDLLSRRRVRLASLALLPRQIAAWLQAGHAHDPQEEER